MAHAAVAIRISAEDFVAERAFLMQLQRELAAVAGEQLVSSRKAPALLETIGSVVSLCDRASCTVLLEDTHLLSEATSEALLLGVSRYGRSARVVVTTRRRPLHDDLVESTLVLEPLAPAAVERIVARLRPNADPGTLREIVSLAGGSPRLARQHALGLDVRRPVVEGLSAEEAALLSALAELDSPITLEQALGRPDQVVALLNRGVVERGIDGVRIVPSMRALVRASTSDRAAARRAALELACQVERPAARFEAVRLALLVDDVARAVHLVATQQDELFESGYAEALFDLLVDERNEALSSICMRIADYLRSGRALQWAIEQPEPLAWRDRLLSCRLLAHAGRVHEAETRAARVVADAETPEDRVEAAALHAEIVCFAGDPSRSVALLQALEPSSDWAAVDRDLRLVTAFANAGDSERASATARAAMHAYDRLALRERRECRPKLIGALLANARFRELERLLGTDTPSAGAPAPEVFAVLAMAVERGHCDLARRTLDHARIFCESSVAMRFASRYNELRMRVVRGPMEGLVDAAREGFADDRTATVDEYAGYLYAARAAIAIVLEPGADVAPPDLVSAEATRWLTRAWHGIVQCRRGASCDLVDASVAPVDVRVAAGRLEVERLTAEGHIGLALERLDELLHLVRDEGLRLDEVVLLALRLDLRLLCPSATPGAIEAAASELRELASSLSSPRFEIEAAFAHWAASPDRPPRELLVISEQHESPVARRRATALLGRPCTLDALDRRVVSAISSQWASDRDLVLDLETKTVRLPSGRRIDLSASALHIRLLDALFRAGGEATKAALAQDVWGRRTYHPHRDDKRLQVAIHRLRRALEDDPSRPTLLLRCEDSYRLGCRIVVGRLQS